MIMQCRTTNGWYFSLPNSCIDIAQNLAHAHNRMKGVLHAMPDIADAMLKSARAQVFGMRLAKCNRMINQHTLFVIVPQSAQHEPILGIITFRIPASVVCSSFRGTDLSSSSLNESNMPIFGSLIPDICYATEDQG